MKTILGSTKVVGGYYLNRKTLEICTVRNDGELLPGNESDLYIHVPVPALLVLVPVLGAIFAMFLPLLGFVMPIMFLSGKLAKLVSNLFGELMTTISQHWAPGEAYLVGKPAKMSEDIKKENPEVETDLKKLHDEIQHRRGLKS
jgi:hypothetical protein